MTEADAFVKAVTAAVPAAPQCGSEAEPHHEAQPQQPQQPHADELAAYRNSPDALFNDTVIDGHDSNQVKRSEAPHHRLMVLLKSQGYSNNEIAEMTGYGVTTVSNVLRQPWARRRIVELITKHGLVGVQQLLEGELANNVMTLIEVRDDPNSRDSTRVNAANSLLDRFLGKPVARVETTQRDAPATTVEELQKQLDSLKAEEIRLRAN
jgi:lambda repressor-like predicted transcriptional regulator